MPNALFNALGSPQNNMLQQFAQFMQSMRGRDPNQMINELVVSGKVSQAQLNQVQKQAQQMESAFNSVRGMFGK